MPLIQSAIKKLRQDKKQTEQNKTVKQALKKAIRDFEKNPEKKKLAGVYSMLDKALKKKLIKKNRVGRLKSRLARLKATKARQNGKETPLGKKVRSTGKTRQVKVKPVMVGKQRVRKEG